MARGRQVLTVHGVISGSMPKPCCRRVRPTSTSFGRSPAACTGHAALRHSSAWPNSPALSGSNMGLSPLRVACRNLASAPAKGLRPNEALVGRGRCRDSRAPSWLARTVEVGRFPTTDNCCAGQHSAVFEPERKPGELPGACETRSSVDRPSSPGRASHDGDRLSHHVATPDDRRTPRDCDRMKDSSTAQRRSAATPRSSAARSARSPPPPCAPRSGERSRANARTARSKPRERSGSSGRSAFSARATSDAVPALIPQTHTTSLLRTLIALRASPSPVTIRMSA